MGTVTAYIGLGSNLPSIAGPPEATLTAALQSLKKVGEITAQSSFYETEPVGITRQPPFVNAVVALQTELEPVMLLRELLAIEREFGRDRNQTPLKGPRTLDLDLLLYGTIVLDALQLKLPHPAVPERRFVLAPLAEIAPQLRHPLLGKTVLSLLDELPDEGQNRAGAVRVYRHR